MPAFAAALCDSGLTKEELALLRDNHRAKMSIAVKQKMSADFDPENLRALSQ